VLDAMSSSGGSEAPVQGVSYSVGMFVCVQLPVFGINPATAPSVEHVSSVCVMVCLVVCECVCVRA